MSERLPELLDAKALRLELGITRAAAEAIMRHLPVVQIEGLRKVYVRRADVAALPRGEDLPEERSTIVIGVGVGWIPETRLLRARPVVSSGCLGDRPKEEQDVQPRDHYTTDEGRPALRRSLPPRWPRVSSNT